MQLALIRWGLGALVVVVGLAWFLYFEGDDIKHQLKGYSFSETLPETIDDMGGDARVVSVLVRDKNVFFSVLKDDGKVHERFYGQVCTKSTTGSDCAYRETNDDHDASAAERKRARVRLDDLDQGVVDRLRKESGVGKEVPLGLRGRSWVVGSFEEDVAAIAKLDGSGLHRAETGAERALARSVAEDPGR